MKTFLTIRRARPLGRNIQCVSFMASAALVGLMLAQGIRVRTNVLDGWHYVAPLEDIGPNRFYELLQNSEFKYIAIVTFLVSPTGSLQTFTVPKGWNSSNNKIETIGGGGGGSAIYVSDPVGGTIVGGSGAAYSAITNFTSTPGSSISYQIGAGGASVTANFESGQSGHDGGDSWFNGTSLASASVSAERGHGGASATTTFTAGINGGQASNGTGSTKFSGGASGSATTSGDPVSVSGGGGAAGPNGNGNASANVGIGAGSAGGSGDAGSGGAGGAAGTTGGNGSGGTEYDGSHGCGGGGGAGISQATPATTGGNGGLYGAGGGGQGNGSGVSGGTSGAGAQGLIVVTNVRATRTVFAGIIG